MAGKTTTTKKKTTKKPATKKVAKTVAKKAPKKKQVAKTTKKKATTTSAKRSAAQRLAETPAPRAASSQEQTIVEKVLNERNLTTGVEGLSPEQHAEIQNMVLTGAPQQSIAKNDKQQAFLDSFNQIFDQTVAEVENLASYVPREDVLELAQTKPEVLEALRDAEPWTVHYLNETYFLKTGVKTIEPVRDYIFKLEKVVLNYSKQTEEAKSRLALEELQVDSLKKELYDVKNQGFLALIKLAFSSLFTKENTNG